MTFLCVMNDMQLMKVMKVMEVMKIMTHGTLSNIMSELPGVHWAPFLASSEALVFIVALINALRCGAKRPIFINLLHFLIQSLILFHDTDYDVYDFQMRAGQEGE